MGLLFGTDRSDTYRDDVDETPTAELNLAAIQRELDAHPTWTLAGEPTGRVRDAVSALLDDELRADPWARRS